MKKIALLLILLSFPSICEAAEFRDDIAERVILSTAGDEGYPEMLAIAHVLRNMTEAYDLYNHQEMLGDTSNIPKELKALAKKAWKASKRGPDPTKGATHWYNATINGSFVNRDSYGQRTRDKLPWLKENKKTVKIGRHNFYAP